MINITKHQFGKAINVIREIEGSAEVAIDRLAREGVPNRLNALTTDYRDALPKIEKETISFEKAFALTFARSK